MKINSIYEKAMDSFLTLMNQLSMLNVQFSNTKTDIPEVKKLYEQNGFITLKLSKDVADSLRYFFNPEKKIEFSKDDCSQRYLTADLSEDTINKLNRNLEFFGPPKNVELKGLLNILEKLTPYIESAIGSKFKVGNVRAWNTRSNEDENHGPTNWHTDGVSEFLRKILIYPVPPNIENGSLEIIGKNGARAVLNSDMPMAVFADVGVLMHRGIPPKKKSVRPLIEITITPSFYKSINLDFNGQNARIPLLTHRDFFEVESFFKRLQSRIYSERENLIFDDKFKVNLGGGRYFDYPGWVNFDVASPSLRSRIEFNETTQLPYESNKATCVYSSHCFEHLPDAVVLQLLHETSRILNYDGVFIVKLPDFDRVLVESRSNYLGGILNPRLWGLESLFEMWKNNSLPVNSFTIASMILCGFWTPSYGEEFFDSIIKSHIDAFHGPARISQDKLKMILSSSTSAHFVSSMLRSEIIRSEYMPIFNHQNAWSFSEFVSLASVCGLEYIGCNSPCNDFKDIPTISEMCEISKYYVFKKQTN